MLATTIHKSNTTPHHQSRATTRRPRHHGATPKKGTGLLSQSPIVCPAVPRHSVSHTASQRLLLHQTPPTTGKRVPHGSHPPQRKVSLVVLLRKEVIQPHLPVRLPCYDFVPIADPTFDGSLPQGVRPPASGVTDFHDVTGGVYKARERIHRSVADLRLLATPTSRGRVADPDPN